MRIFKFVAGVGVLFSLCGCTMSWQPQVDGFQQSKPNDQSIEMLESADNCFGNAGDLQKLTVCEDLYLAVLKENPGDYNALTQLSTINILLGTAYTNTGYGKSEHFLQAMRYAEQAMYSNTEFRTKIEQGETLWGAIDSLSEREAEAMFFWVTALQYEFKESMSLPEKVFNIKWLQRALLVIEQVEKGAPEFGGGGVEFAKAICYYALPGRYGGSEELGDEAMQAAIEHNDNWLLPRWARAKYYYVITGQTEKSQSELKWIAGQNPEQFRDPYPWRIHFIENSAALLD